MARDLFVMIMNRIRELFDFAQAEPLLIDDMARQLHDFSEEEIDRVEQVCENVMTAISCKEEHVEGMKL